MQVGFDLVIVARDSYEAHMQKLIQEAALVSNVDVLRLSSFHARGILLVRFCPNTETMYGRNMYGK